MRREEVSAERGRGGQRQTALCRSGCEDSSRVWDGVQPCFGKKRWVGAPLMRCQRSPSDGLDLWTLTTTSRTGGRKAVFWLLLSMHLIGRELGGTDQYIPIFTNVAKQYLAFEQFTSATHGNFT